MASRARSRERWVSSEGWWKVSSTTVGRLLHEWAIGTRRSTDCSVTSHRIGEPSRCEPLKPIVGLIGNTRTNAGLRVRAKFDEGKYPTGVATTDAEMDALLLHRNEFHGDWNYELHPR